MKKENKKEVEIIASEQSQIPIFSNVVRVDATKREVIIEFAYIQPNTNKGILLSRVALTPEHAKSLKGVLNQLLEKYDKKKEQKEQ